MNDDQTQGDQEPQQTQDQGQPVPEQPAAPAGATEGAPHGNVVDGKAAAALAYIIFFLPYILAPKSRFARYHANQGLLLLILAVAVNILGMAIPLVGWFVILPLGSILVLIFFIMGIVNALNGHQKPLPWIGRWTLLK